MRTLLIGLATASLAAVTVAAQNPPPMPPQEPTTQTQPRTGADQRDAGRTVTVQGCLMREADVPGLKPNIAERAGVTEDFVITSAKVVKGSAPAGEGRSTTSNMFEVEGLSKDQIQSNLNKRVEVDGTIEGRDDRGRGDTTRSPVPPRPDPSAPDPTPNPRGTTAPTDSAGDLAQLQAKNIRTVPGDCPTAR